MPADIATPAMPAGYRLRFFDEVDSTMEEARRCAEAGEAGGLWLWAGQQKAGRGRRGRAWASAPGNLYCTLLLRPDCTAEDGARLSFAAALGVAEALDSFINDAGRVALKWPNDVLVDGRKVAGILLESTAGAEGRLTWLAIGIGVNLVTYPEETQHPATSLAAAHGSAPAPGAVLGVLAERLCAWIETWRTEGFEPIRAAWLARAARVGQTIEVRLSGETLTGTFSALDRAGYLVLEQPDGSTRRIGAGDVFFPDAV